MVTRLLPHDHARLSALAAQNRVTLSRALEYAVERLLLEALPGPAADSIASSDGGTAVPPEAGDGGDGPSHESAPQADT